MGDPGAEHAVLGKIIVQVNWVIIARDVSKFTDIRVCHLFLIFRCLAEGNVFEIVFHMSVQGGLLRIVIVGKAVLFPAEGIELLLHLCHLLTQGF